MVEEKLVQTMRHDLRTIRTSYEQLFSYICTAKSGLRALQITLFGARQMAKKVVSARTTCTYEAVVTGSKAATMAPRHPMMAVKRSVRVYLRNGRNWWQRASTAKG
jgi:hypothetical protein